MQEDTVRREDAILKAVGFTAEHFLRTADWSEAVRDVLAILGEATGASRVHVYDIDRRDNEVFCTLRHEWIAAGITPVIAEPAERDFPLKGGGYERWIDELGTGAVIKGLRREFPESERQYLENEDTRSILVVPVFVEGEWWGWIGFDDCLSDREWASAEVDGLRAAAGTLGAAIYRDRVDRERLETEQKYRALVENTRAIIYTEPHGSELTSIYVSPRIEEVLGYTPEEWIEPGAWVEAMHPDDRERVVGDVTRIEAEDEGIWIADYRMVSRDGRVVWFHDEAVLIRDRDGKALYWQGVMHDTTEQREATNRLHEAEARYRTLVEKIPAVIYVEDPKDLTSLRYISPQVESMLGYPTEEWMASQNLWSSILYEDDRERTLAVDRESTAGGGPFIVEYRAVHKDGHTVWIHDEATLVRDDDGEPLFWHGLMLDITDQKASEADRREAETRFQTLVEQTPAVTYVDKLEGRSVTDYVSPQVEAMFGYSAEEWLKDPDMWENLLHPEDRDRVIRDDDRIDWDADEQFVQEYRMVARDGHEVWVHDEASLVRDSEGKPLNWQGVMVDVTELKRAQDLEKALEVERGTSQRLRDLDEMKNTFLTAVSHDLRTPLAAILGLALTLERGDIALTPKEMGDLTRRIAGNARKLDKLVTDLLDLDRLSRGILEPNRHPTDVGALVRKVVDESDVTTSHRVQVEAEPVIIAVDGAKVERIVENLLANSVRHTPVGTHVWIAVRPVEGGALITVDDDGPGLPEGSREALFEPFRQGTGAPQHSPGVGIGLSLVARFAELHDGRAWAEEREGCGASFRVFLAGEKESPSG